jgi:hypothetical protein
MEKQIVEVVLKFFKSNLFESFKIAFLAVKHVGVRRGYLSPEARVLHF